jgi:hypothetical protein
MSYMESARSNKDNQFAHEPQVLIYISSALHAPSVGLIARIGLWQRIFE